MISEIGKVNLTTVRQINVKIMVIKYGIEILQQYKVKTFFSKKLAFL